MRFLIQRVNHASVTVDDKKVGKIGKGLLVFVGVFEEDTEEVADKLIRKLLGLRIFTDVNGELLIVSQFTLCADCKKGNRPSFTKAGNPEKANALYEYVLSACREKIAVTESGIFGADMRVDLSNDGPFTILFDSREM
jgi:D-tyrosyl-tRNA(Tyr) deacylase